MWPKFSARLQGLMNAVLVVLPNCEHRYCKRHLLQNMASKGFRVEKYKGFVDAAVYATTMWQYEKVMEGLEKFHVKVWEYLAGVGQEHFSRHAFSPEAKSDLVVNNLGEGVQQVHNRGKGQAHCYYV